MNTDDLLEQVVSRLEPVRVLPAPSRRAALWVLGAAAYFAILTFAMSAMNGTSWATASGAFWWSLAASIAAGVLASVAAFASVVPGSGRWAAWGALAAVGFWLMASAWAPVLDWSAVASATHEWLCVGFIVVGGAPLAAILVRQLREGAPLTPGKTAALAALAVGALGNVGACVSLPHDNGAVTLVWHCVTLLAIVGLATVGGRRFFSWS